MTMEREPGKWGMGAVFLFYNLAHYVLFVKREGNRERERENIRFPPCDVGNPGLIPVVRVVLSFIGKRDG